MKYKLISSKIFRTRSIPIFSLAIFSVFAIVFMQNCSYGSRGKRNRIYTEKLSLPPKGKKWGPRMRYVEGGSISIINGLGSPYRIDMSKSGDITLTSFLIAECPTTNREYFIYFDDLKRSGKIREYKAAQPDVNVWKKEFTANDNLRNYPYAQVFLDYPAVGLNYKQCVDYCRWLTEKEESLRNPKKQDKINLNKKNTVSEDALSDATKSTTSTISDDVAKSDINDNTTQPVVSAASESITNVDTNEVNITNAVSDEEGEELEPLDLEEIEKQYVDYVERATSEAKYVYRLPTEAEIVFAAKASQTTQKISRDEKGEEEVIETTRVGDYGNGESSVRIQDGKNAGQFVGLFQLNRGNYKGIPGESDNNGPTENVYTRDPNGLGLRGTYGNVYIWTSDFYLQDPASVNFSDYNPAHYNDLYTRDYDSHSPLSETCMVIYGGAFDGTFEEIRSFMSATKSSNNLGFRVVASVA